MRPARLMKLLEASKLTVLHCRLGLRNDPTKQRLACIPLNLENVLQELKSNFQFVVNFVSLYIKYLYLLPQVRLNALTIDIIYQGSQLTMIKNLKAVIGIVAIVLPFAICYRAGLDGRRAPRITHC